MGGPSQVVVKKPNLNLSKQNYKLKHLSTYFHQTPKKWGCLQVKVSIFVGLTCLLCPKKLFYFYEKNHNLMIRVE